MTEELKEEQKQEVKKEQPNAIAALSYIGILVLVPLLAVKDDEFVKFHTKQGLVLFIAEIATMTISWLPIIGWIFGFFLGILWLILSIMGILNVLAGKKKPLPVIGGFADKFKI